MVRQGMQQSPPNGREFGDADDLDGSEQRGRMIQPRETGRDEISRSHHR